MKPVRNCFPIIGIVLAAMLTGGVSFAPSPLEAQRPVVRKPAVKVEATPEVNPALPVNGVITAIDARTGLVSAKNLETDATFRFLVTDRRLLGSLTVGQEVYADQAAKKAGVNPGTPCCEIVAPAGPVNTVRPAQPVDTYENDISLPDVAPAQPINDISLPDVAPAQPINGVITAIDARTGLVSAKNLETDATFRFLVTDRRLLGSLKVGQEVYADQAGKKVGVNPIAPCCGIVAPAAPVNTVRPAQPVNTVRPAQPVNTVRPAQPVDTYENDISLPDVAPAQPINDISLPDVAPAQPVNDVITAIDARTGLVSAKNLKTGATFRFLVTDRRLLGSLKVGQEVYADQAANKVGINPIAPCCNIVAPAGPINGISLPDVAPAQPVDGIGAAAQADDGHKSEIDILAVTSSQAQASQSSQAQASQSSQAQASEYEAIVANARGIKPKSLSPQDIQQFNARMRPVRSELQRWAARHGVELKTETVTHELPPETEESRIRIGYDPKDGTVTCASTMTINGDECTLVSVRVDPTTGAYECVYSCPDSDDVQGKGDAVKVMQENY